MDEIRNDIPKEEIIGETESAPETKITLEKATPPAVATETAVTDEPKGAEITETDEDAPAELSLEGRKAQLEEKISAEIGRTDAPTAQPPVPSPYSPSPYGAPVVPNGRKEKTPSGAKAYITVIVGLIIVFTAVFAVECVRAYNSNGFFGGSLDDILSGNMPDGSTFDPFGRDSDKDGDSSGFRLFPFTDGSDDDDDSDSDYMLDGSDSMVYAPDDDAAGTVTAPDLATVIDPNAAKLKAEDQPDDIDSAEYTARKAYKRVSKSVVTVVVYSGGNDTIGNSAYKEGTGSGIIVSEDGYIITNSHVIEDSSDYGVEILFDDKSYAAAIVGFDSRTDLAVLKISAKGLTPAEFMNSDQLEIGQDALAVGNPGGVEYSNSLTRGCVSAVNRTVRSNTVVSYIQTDAAINPGNSGGPLLNSAGQVMGITTIKIADTDYEGMGFAIPSNTVIEIANDLISKGYVAGRVKLGILAKEYNTYDPSEKTDIRGIEIVEINDGSPLLDTDVQSGDIITHIDGESVTTFSKLYSILGEHEAGDEVTLSLYRPTSTGNASKKYKVTVKLAADEG